MRKIVTGMLAIILVTGLLTGCTGTKNSAPQSNGGDNQPAQTSPQDTSQGQTSVQNPVDTSQFIGEDKAKEIALNREGLTADQVIFDRVELDFDDGIYRYEVEFRHGNTEYDADVKADDGTIISWDIDLD